MSPVRFVIVLVIAFAATARSASAGDDLEAARSLFSEALADQQAHRSDVALEKFERVALVKETAQVEYRIATCLEDLGRWGAAARRYEVAIRLGLAESSAADVVDASRSRIAELGARVTRLTAIVRSDVPRDVDIVLDGTERLAHDERSAQAFVDPGDHVLEARSAGTVLQRIEFAATAGARIEVTLALASLPPLSPPAPVSAVPKSPHTDLKPRVQGQGSRALAIGATVTTGVLAAASLVSLGLRERDIRGLREACPSNVCPFARRDELTSKRDEAVALGAAAVATGVVAACALGVATWAWLAQRSAPVRVAPHPSAIGMVLDARF